MVLDFIIAMVNISCLPFIHQELVSIELGREQGKYRERLW